MRDSNPQRAAKATTTAHLPEHVQRVITELVADAFVCEIWLIGSQLNGTASPSSDWDLLVFANREPNVREVRCLGVDVIWKGPTKTLLEGELKSQHINFNNFMWAEGGDGTAEYVGCKINEFEPGIVRDTSIPFALRPKQSAARIWPEPKSDVAPDSDA